MTAATQPKKRIKVTFPQPVFELLVADVPPGNRSAFIVSATEEALRRAWNEPFNADCLARSRHRTSLGGLSGATGIRA